MIVSARKGAVIGKENANINKINSDLRKIIKKD